MSIPAGADSFPALGGGRSGSPEAFVQKQFAPMHRCVSLAPPGTTAAWGVPRGHVMLDEKEARPAHVAIVATPVANGGDNEATIQVDCVFSEPELEADGRRVEVPRLP